MSGADAAELTKVVVRVKPVSKDCTRSVVASGANSLCFSNDDDGSRVTFGFDRVLGESATQEDVYGELTGLVDEVLKGRNATIITYGQTGSGKTHTLIGGIVPRAAEQVFAAAASLGKAAGASCRVHLSAVEIYCERIRDLLSFSAASDNLPVQQDKGGSVYVAGAHELAVSRAQEVVQAMQAALSNRAIAATGMNAASSRSHCLVCLTVDRQLPGTSAVRGKLCLVDLAGSERHDRTNAVGRTAEEGRLINKSLSALGNVVSTLTERGGGPGHVPYRDSKLTRVLQDSIGGNALTAIIICCSPAQDDAAESLSSLRFGARAAGIVSSVQTNHRQQDEAGRLLEAALAECAALRRQLGLLEAELVALKAPKGGSGHSSVGMMSAAQQRSTQIMVWLLRSVILAAIILQGYVQIV